MLPSFQHGQLAPWHFISPVAPATTSVLLPDPGEVSWEPEAEATGSLA